MPEGKFLFIPLAAALAAFMATASHAQVKYVQSPSLAKVVSGQPANCPTTAESKVPLIAWGGDIATIHANGGARKTQAGSLFGGKGLKLELYREDNFVRQLEGYLSCQSPFLRGTMGMINMAAEVTEKDPRTSMVIIYKLTDSAGGDALVVKGGIKSPKELKGKTIVLQRYGPHVDYLTTILDSVGLKPGDVNIKWVEDLIEVDASSNSPAKAMREDPSVDAAFVIIPDALALTSEGKVGTGSEDSVKGATILLTTKTADRVIMDVYAVRKDYFQAHEAQVRDFAHGLMLASEAVKAIFEGSKSGPEFTRLITASAEILLDSKSATADAEAMYHDARHMGFSGNSSFFSSPDQPRSFENVSRQIQAAFVPLGLVSKKTTLNKAGWEYSSLSAGLSPAKAEQPRFNPQEVTKLVTSKQQKGTLTEGELYAFEVYFSPNQNSFPAEMYKEAFDKVIELASIYGGALLTVEGHSDPSNYLQEKNKGQAPLVLNQIKQSARNLSYARANSLKDSLITYAKSKGVSLDQSQFGVVGHGVMQPNTPKCVYDTSGDITKSCYPATKEEWNAMRRVVFRLIQVEAEADIFKPL